jgi:hypothetical protein
MSSRKTVECRDVKFEEERAFQKSYQNEDVLETEVQQQEEDSSPQPKNSSNDGQSEKQVDTRKSTKTLQKEKTKMH